MSSIMIGIGEPEEKSKDHMLLICASNILKAIESKDARALADALECAFAELDDDQDDSEE